MSENTLKMIANDYQTGLLDRLNDLVKGVLLGTSFAFGSSSLRHRNTSRKPGPRNIRLGFRGGQDQDSRVQLRVSGSQ
jgi:hypothetical protein